MSHRAIGIACSFDTNVHKSFRRERESTVTSVAILIQFLFRMTAIQQPCLALPRSTRGTPRRWATLATSTTRWTWPAWRTSRASRSTTSSRRHRRRFVHPFFTRLGDPRSGVQTRSKSAFRFWRHQSSFELVLCTDMCCGGSSPIVSDSDGWIFWHRL